MPADGSGWLQKIPGIGPALARRLHRRGIRRPAQLRAIADELPAAARAYITYRPLRRIPHADAAAVLAELAAGLTFHPAGGRRRRFPAYAVGSARRGEDFSRDLDLLVVVPDDVERKGLLATAALTPGPSELVEAYASGGRRRSFIVRRGDAHYRADVFLATAREKPYALFHYTGNKNYNIRIRAYAKRAGYTLNQYGLYYAGSARRVAGTAGIKTERDLAQFLGVTYRPPSGRR